VSAEIQFPRWARDRLIHCSSRVCLLPIEAPTSAVGMHGKMRKEGVYKPISVMCVCCRRDFYEYRRCIGLSFYRYIMGRSTRGVNAEVGLHV
jgi:hypothetical protein